MSGIGGKQHDDNDEEPCDECGMMECNCDENLDEAACNECGMMECKCDEQLDEVESEDQMTYQMAENNPPDNGSANSRNATRGNNAANMALAMADRRVSNEGRNHLEEWANDAGPGKTVSDTTFEQDIDFMTKTIAGGLNKPKSTGQTTIPIIAGEKSRMHSHDTTDINESITDWLTLAGIKK
jgi:hypothetical protein